MLDPGTGDIGVSSSHQFLLLELTGAKPISGRYPHGAGEELGLLSILGSAAELSDYLFAGRRSLSDAV